MNEIDLYHQLQSVGLELVQCTPLSKKNTRFSLSRNKIKIRELIQLFVHLEQMQSAGVPLLDALGDIREGAEKANFRDMMSDIYRDVQEGAAFSEALAKHPKIFKPLYISLIKAAEDTGDLTSAYLQLVAYLKWVDDMQYKIRKATRYPMIVSIVVLAVITFMMSVVVPQIVGFLKYLDFELPFVTIALIATSNFFVTPQFTLLWIPFYGALIVTLTPILLFLTLKISRKSSDKVAYKLDSIYLSMPIMGNLIRKISIARYAQTFAAMFASGIGVVQGLGAARQTVNNLALNDAMQMVEEYVQSGSTLSESLNASGEFPTMVIRMVKIGEESGKLSPVLEQVSEFYTRDVDEAIDGMIEMIQPALTVILAAVIIWIAAGSLGPIYMNLGNMVDI